MGFGVWKKIQQFGKKAFSTGQKSVRFAKEQVAKANQAIAAGRRLTGNNELLDKAQYWSNMSARGLDRLDDYSRRGGGSRSYQSQRYQDSDDDD
jgi:hypothetical protein